MDLLFANHILSQCGVCAVRDAEGKIIFFVERTHTSVPTEDALDYILNYLASMIANKISGE